MNAEAKSAQFVSTSPSLVEELSKPVLVWLMQPDCAGVELPSLADLIGRPEWMARAACRGEDRSTFFPGRGAYAYRKARELCASCPVCCQCLEHALADEELVGMWAGTTEAEREAMRARMRPVTTLIEP